MPKPRDRGESSDAACTEKSAADHRAPNKPPTADTSAPHTPSPKERDLDAARAPSDALAIISVAPPPKGDVIMLAPNILSVKHWDRLLGGLLYAASPRVDWASLLRRSFSVDVLECPRCHGRLRVVAVITEREPVRRILAHLGMPTEAPLVARARHPTEDFVDDEAPQLALDLA